MIGELVVPKPPVLKPRPVPKIVDVFGDRANTCGRIARDPNTNYNIRLMQYNQRKNNSESESANSIKKKIEDEKNEAKYMKHAENRGFQRELKKRVEQKIFQYDENIIERRKKMNDLIAKEEREFLKEVVDNAQKGKEEKIKERIQKLHDIKLRNEEERLEIVKEKRLQQYLVRCEEFRPAVANQRLRETKKAQLLQIEENEYKRKCDQEIENFWHDVKMKYCATIAEREEQDRLTKAQRDYERKITTELQIKQKMGEEQQRKQEKIEDGIRLQKIKEEIEEEERAYLEQKQKTKSQLLECTKAQIKEQHELLKRISDAETQIQRAYEKEAETIIEKEREKEKAKKSTGYQDMINYQNYLVDLKRQREEEENCKRKVLEETLRNIQRKEDDKKCKAEMAKQAFLEEVLKGREIQIEERKKHEEELQKSKELEIKSTIALREQTDKLRNEYKRQNFIKQKKYREDLKQQMAYSKVLEDREKANMKKILDAAETENKLYDSIVAKVLSGSIKISETHPFKHVVNTEKCPCPKPNY